MDASESSDPDGYIASYIWYFDGTPVVDSSEGDYWSWGSLVPGVYALSLVVVDDDGAFSDPFVLSVEVEAPLRADAWIIDVDSSDNVMPGGLITVNVSVGYIFDSETVLGLGIYRIDMGLYVVGAEDALYGEGNKTYSLVFEAPMSPGRYDLIAEVPYLVGTEWAWGNESTLVFMVNVIDYSSDFVEMTDLRYPAFVETGKEIQVSITVRYELTNDTVAFGIVDLDTEEIQVASFIPLTGQGTRTVELIFSAPSLEGAYDFFVSVGPLDGESVDDVFQVTVIPSEDDPEAFFEWWMQDGELYLDSSGSTVDGDATEYRWFIDGELIEDALHWDFWSKSGMEPGVYEVTLIVIDEEKESEPFTLTVEVPEGDTENQVPTADVEWWITEGTLHVDAGGSSDPDGEIVDYTWVINGEEDVSFRGLESWSWSEIPPGTYSITLHVEDDSGSEGTHRVTVVVNGIPGFPYEALLIGLIIAGFMLKRDHRLGSHLSSIPSDL